MARATAMRDAFADEDAVDESDDDDGKGGRVGEG